MEGSAPYIPADDIEATAQQPVQDEDAPADRDRSSLSDMAESVPQLPKDDMETAAQQPVQDKNPPADGDKCSHGDESPELTYEQRLYRYIDQTKVFIGLDFDNLSRVNLVHLMNELAKYEQAMKKNKASPQDIEHLGDLLHRYSKSVKVAMVIGFSLRCLYVSYRCSGPRILVQKLQVRPVIQGNSSFQLTATNIS